MLLGDNMAAELKIFAVHGTQWSEGADRGDWWADNGILQRKLERWIDGRFRFYPVEWGGANSEQARNKGSRTLIREIQTACRRADGDRSAVIAHSHGGNVAARAFWKNQVFDHLITVGTPYYGFFPSWWSAVQSAAARIVLLVLLAIAVPAASLYFGKDLIVSYATPLLLSLVNVWASIFGPESGQRLASQLTSPSGQNVISLSVAWAIQLFCLILFRVIVSRINFSDFYNRLTKYAKSSEFVAFYHADDEAIEILKNITQWRSDNYLASLLTIGVVIIIWLTFSLVFVYSMEYLGLSLATLHGSLSGVPMVIFWEFLVLCFAGLTAIAINPNRALYALLRRWALGLNFRLVAIPDVRAWPHYFFSENSENPNWEQWPRLPPAVADILRELADSTPIKNDKFRRVIDVFSRGRWRQALATLFGLLADRNLIHNQYFPHRPSGTDKDEDERERDDKTAREDIILIMITLALLHKFGEDGEGLIRAKPALTQHHKAYPIAKEAWQRLLSNEYRENRTPAPPDVSTAQAGTSTMMARLLHWR